MIKSLKIKYATLAIVAVALSACVEKPATNPESTIHFQTTDASLAVLDTRFRAYAESNGFRYESGIVGNSDNTNFTIHFVRRDAQIIGVDPFVKHCFRLSFYKTLRFDRASDAEMLKLKTDIEELLQLENGITPLSKQQADELGC